MPDVREARRWALDRIDAWWRGTAPVFVVTGPAGVGKSGLLDRWIHPAGGPSRAHALWRGDAGRATPDRVIEEIAGQLVDRVPGYRRRLLAGRWRIDRTVRVSVRQHVGVSTGSVTAVKVLLGDGGFRPGTWDRVLSNPVRTLPDRRRPPGGVLVVIDGLDAVVDVPGELTLIRVLADHARSPGSGLRLLLGARTTRHTAHLVAGCPGVDLGDADPAEFTGAVGAALAAYPEPYRSTLVARVLREAAGNHLVAEAAVRHVRRTLPDPADVDAARVDRLDLATGIRAIWRDRLATSAATDRENSVRKLLDLVAHARGDGLPEPVLTAAARELGIDGTEDLAAVRDDLSPFVADPHGTARPRHASLRAYLRDPADTSSRDASRRSEQAIATALLDLSRHAWHDAGDYPLRYLLDHLTSAVAGSDPALGVRLAGEVLTDPGFIRAATRRVGLVAFLRDLDRLAAAAGDRLSAARQLLFLAVRQVGQLAGWDPDRELDLLLRQLLHEARSGGSDLAGALARALDHDPALRTRWSTSDPRLTRDGLLLAARQVPVQAAAVVDHRRVVTVSDDGTGTVWDVDTGTGRPLQPYRRVLCAVAAGPSRVVAGAGNGAVVVWDLADGRRERVFPGHPRCTVTGVAVDRSGRRAVTCATDGGVRVWNLASGTALRSLVPGLTPGPVVMAATDDCGTVVAGDSTGAVVLWDAAGHREALRFPGHRAPVRAVAVDGVRRLAATGAADGTVRLWALDPFRGVDRISAPSAVDAVAFGPDGRHLVFGTVDDVWIRDLVSGEARRLPGPTGVTGLAAPGGDTVVGASTDGRLRVWAIDGRQPPQVLAAHRARVTAIAVTALGRHVLTASMDGTVRLWRPWPGSAPPVAGHPAATTVAAPVGDGDRLVTGAADGGIWLRSTETGRVIHSSGPQRHGAVTALAATARADRIVVGTAAGAAGLWDPTVGDFAVRFARHARAVTAVVVTPTGILTASADGTARWSDPETGRCRDVLHEDSGFHAAASAGGSTVLLAAGDHTVWWWDPAGGAAPLRRRGHWRRVTAAAALPGAGQVVTVSLDATVRVWDLAAGVDRTLAGHTAEVTTVATVPGRIITGAEDGVAMVWSPDRGSPEHVLRGSDARVTAVALTPDGHRAVTGSADGGVRIWHVDPVSARRPARPAARIVLPEPVSVLTVLPTDPPRLLVGGGEGQVSLLDLS